ncbi:MAG: hypothetical protein A2202_04540 [Bdellovibrionales bacterium RIFOXYA1_FULL_36_14]|nr:MAG: hypothetical protein A2202_04540 [Bdellovibrionales bacterium RIFOXYA1_FULL_36_14]
MRKTTFLILASFFLCFTLLARQPAVEPVMGLSIDEEKPIAPAKAKGYKFKPNSERTNRELAANIYSNDGVRETKLDKGSNTLPIIFIIFISVLPIIIWFTIIKGINVKNSRSQSGKLKNNLSFISDYQNDNLEDHDDDNIPKAS